MQSVLELKCWSMFKSYEDFPSPSLWSWIKQHTKADITYYRWSVECLLKILEFFVQTFSPRCDEVLCIQKFIGFGKSISKKNPEDICKVFIHVFCPRPSGVAWEPRLPSWVLHAVPFSPQSDWSNRRAVSSRNMPVFYASRRQRSNLFLYLFLDIKIVCFAFW